MVPTEPLPNCAAALTRMPLWGEPPVSGKYVWPNVRDERAAGGGVDEAANLAAENAWVLPKVACQKAPSFEFSEEW